MKFYIAIFSAWISSTSAKYFFSQKYNRNIFDLLNLLLWIFSDCLAFDRNPTDFMPLFLKIIYYLSILLPTSHAAFMENFTWCYCQPPLEDLIFGSWERFDYLNVYSLRITFFLIINQKVWYPGIYSCCIFS